MKQNFGYRLWSYFRVGWSTYFALFFAGINTATVTYFLAIDKIPFLESIFPTFFHYVFLAVIVFVPLLILVGWVHYRRTPAFGTEAEIQFENNPYMYKIPPGWYAEALFPTLFKMTEFMIKSNNNEKLDKKSIEELVEINKKLDILLKGGNVGKRFSSTSKK